MKESKYQVKIFWLSQIILIPLVVSFPYFFPTKSLTQIATITTRQGKFLVHEWRNGTKEYPIVFQATDRTIYFEDPKTGIFYSQGELNQKEFVSMLKNFFHVK